MEQQLTTACCICHNDITTQHLLRHVNRMHQLTTAESMNNSYNVNKYLDCITCGQICCREKGLRHHIRAQHPELIENHIIAFNAGAAAIPAAAAVPPAVNLLVLEAEIPTSLGSSEGF